MKRYAEYNAYTVSRDMAEAWNLMSARFQTAAKRNLIESGILARIEEAKLSAVARVQGGKDRTRNPGACPRFACLGADA